MENNKYKNENSIEIEEAASRLAEILVKQIEIEELKIIKVKKYGKERISESTI
jgi:transcription antitermination factor NusG